MFRSALLLIIGLTLSGCLDAVDLVNNTSSTYWISKSKAAKIHTKVLDAVNEHRVENDLYEISLSEELNLIAKAHSKDMYEQDRAWHFGSDGSSPLDRVSRSGFNGQLLGENISETYESELETLNAWMQRSDTRSIILHKKARYMGLSWYQAGDGKIWWTQVLTR